MTFSYGHLGGLLAEGAVNWVSGIEQLWNEVEAAETRKNSRIAREIKVALPAELPLDEMRRLVHGFCCNLKDRYGLVAQWAIHAPKYHDKEYGKRVEHEYRDGTIDHDGYLRILSDPTQTNRNFHAHILLSTRQKDHEKGGFFGDKIRCLDNIKTGKEEIQTMRDEWEFRANSALSRAGSNARIDLRSYGDRAAAGDAPEGLVAQPHLGPSAATSDLNKVEGPDGDHQLTKCSASGGKEYNDLVKARTKAQEQNNDLWFTWQQTRTLERQRARLEASERHVAEREVARKKEAAEEKKRISEARCIDDARKAAAEAVHMVAPLGTLADVIARAQRGEKMQMPPGEDPEIDPETYERKASTTPFQRPIKIRRISRIKVRTNAD